MGRPKKIVAEDPTEEKGSSHYEHLKKLANEKREQDKASEENTVVSETIETVYDTRGRPKKRRVMRMKNGNVFRQPYFEEK